MSQRESSGLPLRAMVMVLLFLGVVFLLVGLQAMGGNPDEEDSSIATTTTTSSTPTTTTTPSEEPAQVDVRVFNISEVAGAAEATSNRLREAGWDVTETGNLTLPDTDVTTVFFTDAPGEQEAAEEIGRLLEAPVAPRPPELIDEPPGVLVVVTG
ncbi:MAG: LytR C-terminal domain-containing protein [Actinomycetia bacterium]|nr:LytR C-terminal domain-containing protein [Actinomycetes bacterium]